MDRQLFFFAALLFKTEQEPFLGRIIVLDFEIHDGADAGESVGNYPPGFVPPLFDLLKEGSYQILRLLDRQK
jgi:hypothetical protein